MRCKNMELITLSLGQKNTDMLGLKLKNVRTFMNVQFFASSVISDL